MSGKPEETVWVVDGQLRMLANAERLLEDAELLFHAERFPTALSLALLAFEEIGKIYIIGLAEPDSAKQAKTFHHLTKQQFAAVHLIQVPAMAAFMEFLDKIGAERCTVEEASAVLVALIKSEQEEDSNEEKEKIRQIRKTIEDVMFASVRDSDVGNMLRSIKSGEVNLAKQRGFYCDIDEDGKVLSDPIEITKDEAAYWLDRVRFVVEAAKTISPQGTTGAEQAVTGAKPPARKGPQAG